MSTQIKHHTKSSQGRRRSHMRLKQKIVSKCKQCGAGKLPHHLCQKCKAY